MTATATHGMTQRIVTAKRSYSCEEDFAHDRRINPGDRYVRVTIFPNHDFLGAGRWGKPYQYPICARCGGIA